VDKNSLAWIGFAVMHAHYGVSDEETDKWWESGSDPKLVSGWAAAAIAIADEAIRRYKLTQPLAERCKAPPEVQAMPKPRNILEITRDLSR